MKTFHVFAKGYFTWLLFSSSPRTVPT